VDKEKIYKILNEAYFSENMDERLVISHLPKLLKFASIFVDIGASLGQYTYYANKIIEDGQITAIEADPIRYEKLKSNSLSWMGESTNDINCIRAAVTDEDGKIMFFSTQSNISGGLFKHDIANSNSFKNGEIKWIDIEINAVTLDNLFPDSIPDLVKMDVEGSELRVLKGSERILRQGETTFLIELHKWVDPDGQKSSIEVIKFMKRFGYKKYDFYGKPFFCKKINYRLRLELLLFKIKRKIMKISPVLQN
jgi:FkbM family methyltransferase